MQCLWNSLPQDSVMDAADRLILTRIKPALMTEEQPAPLLVTLSRAQLPQEAALEAWWGSPLLPEEPVSPLWKLGLPESLSGTGRGWLSAA